MEIDSGASPKIARAQASAAKAEGEAAKRIEQARLRVREAEMESQHALENQRDAYEKRSELERTRQAGSLDQQRSSGYERIRELQRTYDREEQRVQHDAEKELGATKQRLGSAIQTTEAEGEKKYRAALAKNYRTEENQRRLNADQLSVLQTDRDQQVALLAADRNFTTEQMLKQNEEERLRLQAETRTAISEAKDHYAEIYGATKDRQQLALGQVSSQANRELAELRQSTAHRLNAYSDRQRDPFYRLVNLNAEIEETDEAFILLAKIPEHEQDKIQVTVRGSEIVIAGQRRNEEKLELAPGHVQRTSAYQTFSESFPISWPVEPRGMIREFRGDTLNVRIPKKSTYGADQFKAKSTAAPAVVEKPQFPKNLPGETQLANQLAEQREAERSAAPEPLKDRASRSLA